MKGVGETTSCISVGNLETVYDRTKIIKCYVLRGNAWIFTIFLCQEKILKATITENC